MRTARARLGALGLDVEVEVEDALDGPRGAGLRPAVSAEALASVPAAIRHLDYARARIMCMARACLSESRPLRWSPCHSRLRPASPAEGRTGGGRPHLATVFEADSRRGGLRRAPSRSPGEAPAPPGSPTRRERFPWGVALVLRLPWAAQGIPFLPVYNPFRHPPATPLQ
jgi:hypothetical protein